MVNSKKMSKSTIAVIALSILLVLSLILTATGAWFTDTEGDNLHTSMDFGHVEVTVVASDANPLGWEKAGQSTNAAAKVVPGDEYAGKFTITNVGNQHIYYTLDYDLAIYAAADYPAKTTDLNPITGITVTATPASLGDPVGYLNPTTGATKSAEQYAAMEAGAEKTAFSKAIYTLDEEGVKVINLVISISRTEVGNEQQEHEYVVDFNASVEAVQKGNFRLGTDNWPTVVDYDHT